MSARRLGRFTARGGDEVERKIRAIVGLVAEIVAREVPAKDLCALVMLGGYGRGEGGVERGADGSERPHNNLDFLLVLERDDRAGAVKKRVDDVLRAIVRQEGVGLDVSVISRKRLERSTPLVMWYDMRFGHKTVLGDALFVPSLRQFTLERIVPWDVRNLLTNRGTLLVLNDLLLARGATEPRDVRTIVKHVVKCVIGYGDALLYFLGDYHWSYLEKKSRMALRRDVPESFRALYDECAEFRLEPRYERYAERDLRAWADEMRVALAPIHLVCEQKRLGEPNMQWTDYVERALQATVQDEWTSARAWGRKLRNAARGHVPAISSLGPRARIGLRAAGLRGALPIAFPAVVYDLAGPARTFAAELLRVPADDATNGVAPEIGRLALERGYLRAWSEVGDTNASHVYRELGLALTAGAA